MQANAVVFTAPNTVEYAPVTTPEPGPADVVVRDPLVDQQRNGGLLSPRRAH